MSKYILKVGVLLNLSILIKLLDGYDLMKQIEICNANIMLLRSFKQDTDWLKLWYELDNYLMDKIK
ncbi:hypothetical protein NRS6206_03905 [Bacillus subtilis]|nr:hypothetical protein AX282_06205 [Bacillus spizizenii]QNN96681.1 hypothetical protein [Bacillus phage phi3Ts]QNN96866.1 hypothetical protein [Bacillus phage Hyb2phi3Ts-SPbeta]QNN97052.1 hypothetical protein [Bacillus phage Hyb3phi3Ts-SPbeta]QNR51585.1 hypothetical protein [Bacillus phage Hyb1phi3Ts-SPbeta]UAW07974.1 hypothetical protein [Bacillus phage BUCT082]UOX38169.1 hypothetical protein [Bacillus phage BUCT083]CAF1773216.1 hypothetical protein NRS6103_03924 [Bacillus subtilis]